MDTLEFLALIFGVVIAVAGWIVAHLLSSRREIQQKRREIRIRYLRDAYSRLAEVADSGGDLVANLSVVQEALNDIQMFGDPAQVDLVGKFVSDLDSGGSASMDELLKQLRNEIRRHLRLPTIDDVRWHIRVCQEDEAE